MKLFIQGHLPPSSLSLPCSCVLSFRVNKPYGAHYGWRLWTRCLCSTTTSEWQSPCFSMELVISLKQRKSWSLSWSLESNQWVLPFPGSFKLPTRLEPPWATISCKWPPPLSNHLTKILIGSPIKLLLLEHLVSDHFEFHHWNIYYFLLPGKQPPCVAKQLLAFEVTPLHKH